MDVYENDLKGIFVEDYYYKLDEKNNDKDKNNIKTDRKFTGNSMEKSITLNEDYMKSFKPSKIYIYNNYILFNRIQQ
jgi:hypothetical protein